MEKTPADEVRATRILENSTYGTKLTGTITDNSGTERTVYVNIPVGTKLRAKSGKRGLSDFGASGRTFELELFTAGREYVIHSTTVWGFTRVGYVMDNDGSLHIASPDMFDLI